MPRKPAKPLPAPAPVPPLDGFDGLVGRIAAASDALREGAMAVVNRSVTARAWLTGCYIVEYEQHGLDRARYGERLLERLAERLEDRGFSLQNLKNFRRFYLLYPGLAAPVARYLETLSGKRQSLTILLRLRRPACGLRKIFQPLEKNFPIIGKNCASFPTIGKIFSNHWKKLENFFQSLENRRKIFPIVGKLSGGVVRGVLCGCLVLALSTAHADMCTRLDVGVGKNGGELVVSFNGIENDRPAMAALLGKVLQKDPGLMCSLFVAPDVTMEELAEVVTWIHGIGFKAFEIFGYSRDALALRMGIGECTVVPNPDGVLEEVEPPLVLPPEVDGTVPLDSKEGGAP